MSKADSAGMTWWIRLSWVVVTLVLLAGKRKADSGLTFSEISELSLLMLFVTLSACSPKVSSLLELWQIYSEVSLLTTGRAADALGLYGSDSVIWFALLEFSPNLAASDGFFVILI